MTDQPGVLLIGPRIPPYGGMALQAQMLERLLNRDGVAASLVASNPEFPRGLRFFERLPGARTFLRSVVFLWRFWRALPQAGTVHVLACSWVYFFFVVYPAVLVGRLRGKRVIVNYRGGEAREFFRWYGWAAKPVFKLAHVVTAPSEFLAEVIRARFQVPVSIVPNILDFSKFRFRERQTFQPRILVTRHLEKIYDIESVLRAFRVVQERHAEASLWIAGTGGEGERLRGLASEWNLNVRFLGHVAHQDLPAIYDQCDIYLNASRVDNFPGALLEASAAGLAVVSTGAGGIPFIYQNGKTALLVEPGDWQGLAEAAETVIERPAAARTMTKEASLLVQACDWTEVRRSLFQAYGFSFQVNEARPDGARIAMLQ